MRHRKAQSLNNRFTSWRNATLASIARSVILQQSIRTTLVRASSAQPMIEKLITLAKADTLFARRQAFAILGDHKLVVQLFKDIGPRFANRLGGYTRIVHFGTRRGDGAQLVVFELTEIKKKTYKKRAKAKEEKGHEELHEAPVGSPEQPSTEEKKPKAASPAPSAARPPVEKKPTKKFFGGLRSIFKKERDAL